MQPEACEGEQTLVEMVRQQWWCVLVFSFKLVVRLVVIFIPLKIVFPDLLVIPIMVAAAGWWSLDIGVNFMLGFHQKGHLELRPKEIAIHYARSWLGVDVVNCCTDWMLLIIELALAKEEKLSEMQVL